VSPSDENAPVRHVARPAGLRWWGLMVALLAAVASAPLVVALVAGSTSTHTATGRAPVGGNPPAGPVVVVPPDEAEAIGRVPAAPSTPAARGAAGPDVVGSRATGGGGGSAPRGRAAGVPKAGPPCDCVCPEESAIASTGPTPSPSGSTRRPGSGGSASVTPSTTASASPSRSASSSRPGAGGGGRDGDGVGGVVGGLVHGVGGILGLG
jgi:hypothetical protein